ncbi:MAG: 4-(cytidine 5'-diphospho)-2-C-methyl-D-erythritol kinase [Lachnospiraceae bacterium]|nr:4-(cytidine 5'-diphospho)-2-C-methyl-D-erythritol kinase [Candidatus Minthocola equi]
MITIKAHSKLNFFLNITGRRADGYHNLDTVFLPISLADEMQIEMIGERKLQLTCEGMNLPEDNTIARAYEMMKRLRPCMPGLSVKLIKHIPQGAGLGGGSADAASFITAVNKEYAIRLTIKQMLEIGAQIGADVPACMMGVPSCGSGTGTELTGLGRNPKPLNIVVIKPTVSFSTPDMYKKYDDLTASGRLRISDKSSAQMAEAVKAGDLKKICDNLYNVFEDVADSSEIYDAKSALIQAGAKGALMTGSGSAVFGLFVSQEEAEKAAGELSSKYEATFCTSYGNISQ